MRSAMVNDIHRPVCLLERRGWLHGESARAARTVRQSRALQRAAKSVSRSVVRLIQSCSWLFRFWNSTCPQLLRFGSHRVLLYCIAAIDYGDMRRLTAGGYENAIQRFVLDATVVDKVRC